MRDAAEPADLADPITPRTWLLLGHKAGDNGQVLALADALGWPYEVKRLVYRPWELLTNQLLGVTLLGLDRKRSTALEPPWPDLVISAGRRNEPVARWIQRQAGGREQVKLVHVGRPWANPDAFDLIVSTPQYALPDRPNVLRNEAPMHRVSATRLAAEGAAWEPRLAQLRRPWIAVLVGGHVGPHTLDEQAGRRLAEEVSRLAEELQGSLLISSSARTPTAVFDALCRDLTVPSYVYRWVPDDPSNPYLAFLALADRLVVTSDSMSMLVEAVATGKPVFIFDIAAGGGRGCSDVGKSGFRLPTRRALVFHLGRMFGPKRLQRDVGALHRAQIAAGRTAWLGQPWPGGRPVAPLRDAERAAQRVRQLFGIPPQSVTMDTDC